MIILALLPHISSAMEQNSFDELVEFSNTRYEALPLGIKNEVKEIEVVSLFCIVTACSGLAVMVTTKKKKKVYDDINYW